MSQARRSTRNKTQPQPQPSTQVPLARGATEQVKLPTTKRSRSQRQQAPPSQAPSDEESDTSAAAPPSKKPRKAAGTKGPGASARTSGGNKTTKGKKSGQNARQQLPDRAARNTHPGLQEGVRAPTRRTPAEAAADREAERLRIQEEIQRGEDARRRLAAMEVEEEEKEEVEDEESNRRLSAVLLARDRRQQLEDELEESFQFSAIEYSEDDEEPELPKKKQGTQGRKGVREDIGAMRNDMRKDGHGGGDGKKTRFSKSDLAPKRYKNEGVESPKKLADLVGGFNDDDIAQERPKFPVRGSADAFVRPAVPSELKRTARNNTFVAVDTDVEPEPQAKPRPVKKANTKGASKKAEPEKKATKAVKTQIHDSGDELVNPDTLQEKLMREPAWRNTFLPALCDALLTSTSPFEAFRKQSAAFLSTVQDAFDVAFPSVQYKLTSSDVMVEEACKRLRVRKSLIASDVLTKVKALFDQPPYKSHQATIRAEAKSALTGAAYYADTTTNPPTKFLQTDLIIEVARDHMSHGTPGVVSAQNPPIGLYVLILTAVERAYGAYHSGSFTTPPDFTQNNCAQSLKHFLGMLKNLSERYWLEILTATLGDDVMDVAMDDTGDFSMVSNYRANLPVPASPKKQ